MSTDQPASRREVLAFIALQDLPMPNEVDLEFGGQAQHLGLELDRAGDVVPWTEVFAIADRQPSAHRWVSDDGAWDVTSTSTWGHWRGWRVRLEATEKTPHAPTSELDEDTTAALREIAGGGEAPNFFDRRAAKDPSVDHDSHSTCWAGPCPECPPEIAGGDQ